MRLRNQAGILFFSKLVNSGIGILLAIVLVRLIPKSEYGSFRQATTFYLFLVGLLGGQVVDSVLYMVPRHDPGKRRAVLAQTFLAEMAVALAACGVLSLGADVIAARLNNPDLAPLLRVLAALPFFERVFDLLPAYMVAVDRAQWAGVFALASALGKAGITVAILAGGGTLSAVFWGHVGLAAVLAACGMALMIRFGAGPWRLDWPLVREAFGFTYPLYLNALAGTLIVQSDKLIASAFTDPATFAVYAVGAMALPLAPLVVESINTASLPPMVRRVEEGRDLDALAVWQEGMRKASLVLFPCSAFFLVAGRDFIVLLYGRQYEAGAWPFVVYMLVLPLQITRFGAMFRAKGRTREILLGTVVGGATTVGAGALLAWAGRGGLLGLVGPALGVWAGYLSMLAILTVRLGRVLNIPLRDVLEWKDLARSLGFSFLMALPIVPLSLLPLPPAARLTLQFVAYAGLLAVGAWRLGMLREDEKKLIASAARILRPRRNTPGPPQGKP